MKKFIGLVVLLTISLSTFAQGRYNLTNHVRLAPDLMFFFPKNKVTGFDIDVNAHYVFNLHEDNLSLYPLAGFNLQNNFQGKQTIKGDDGKETTLDSHSSTNFGFNLGAGLTYNLDKRNFLNVEYKYVFGKDNNSVIAFGWGYRF